MFNKKNKRQIEDLNKKIEDLKKDIMILECDVYSSRDITTNIYSDEDLLIKNVTFHELAQYVLAATPIQRDRKVIVADPSGNAQFHKSDILCTKSEGSDGLSDKRSEK